MHPRNFLVEQLRSQLLGPRGGAREILPPELDPHDEYVTGVLQPHDGSTQNVEEAPEPPADVDIPSESVEDEELDRQILQASVNLACDPRREPSTMGLSWVVRGPVQGGFRVACTLAVYARNEEKYWVRQPFGWVESFQLSEASCERPLLPLNATLVCRVRPRPDRLYQISLHLVHRGLGPHEGKVRAEKLLYQPQLRVLLDPELELMGLSELEKSSARLADEEDRLRLLYRDRPVRARGHFCAATWREIDPEGLHSDVPSPWQWPDGELLSEADRQSFSRADLRSEFLPVLAVPTPELNWRHELGPEPVRRALDLAECHTPELVRQALSPLLDAYQHWLQNLEQVSASLPQRYQKAAHKHLGGCAESLRRMQEGLELLCHDAQVRLAFCFAQRALHEQAAWKGETLTWRPFQLGFFLQSLQGVALAQHPDRQICDLLWFPTGGGKTEAYLGIIAFVAALRRLRHPGFDGVAVISRYTLRLLSIQQFRRGLRVMVACDLLRRQGWLPQGWPRLDPGLWGQHPFSTGLWVGGGVTPNKLQNSGERGKIPGALSLLAKGIAGEGEPAQVLDCPVCSTALAVTESATDELQLYLPVAGTLYDDIDVKNLHTQNVEVLSWEALAMGERQVLHFKLRGADLNERKVDDWWGLVQAELGASLQLQCCRASRPGYRLEMWKRLAHNFVVECPHPGCRLNQQPTERVPISAATTDDQVYGWPPTLLIATVDKFARLPFEPRAATIFGNVEGFHPKEGYYRKGCTQSPQQPVPTPVNEAVAVSPFPPPDLILQDELHLVDGPLGSMMGLYETVVEQLCTRPHPPKYIASTATVREAQEQVQSLFARQLCQFPAAGLSADDNFFAFLKSGDPMQRKGSGRLYMGLCSPGKGAITPLVRAWACLLQAGQSLAQLGLQVEDFDGYWSPVGYFSALSQLASVAGMFRQYIPQRMKALCSEPRELDDPVELSSRIESQRLPSLLSRLEQPYPNAASGVLATSMFGTGVDVPRLSLMIVHGQPKTTSSYIQATGRVGRSLPGLILTCLAPTRPRELNHYEYFTGYHLQLYRGVEPVTVYPFAPRARDRALGPLCVALLRHSAGLHEGWRNRGQCARLVLSELSPEQRNWLAQIFARRMAQQPDMRRAGLDGVEQEVEHCLNDWLQAAEQYEELDLFQYTMQEPASKPVVLGDPQHVTAGQHVVFANTPQSLREVESTTGLKV